MVLLIIKLMGKKNIVKKKDFLLMLIIVVLQKIKMKPKILLRINLIKITLRFLENLIPKIKSKKL